jgi:hypothetical protein
LAARDRTEAIARIHEVERLMHESPKLKFNVNVFRSGVEYPKSDAESWKQDEEQVKLLGAFLKDSQIKALIKDMKTVSGGVPSDSESLEKLFHMHGVNMRYLGQVQNDLKVVPKKKEGETQEDEEIHFNGDFKHLKQIVEKEMFLRSAKHVLC